MRHFSFIPFRDDLDRPWSGVDPRKKERKDEKSINGGEDRCEMPSSLRGLDKNAAYASHASRVEHAVTARGILESSSHLLVNWRNVTWIPEITSERKFKRVSSRLIVRAFEKLRIESSSSFGKLAIHLTNSPRRVSFIISTWTETIGSKKNQRVLAAIENSSN